MSKIKLLSLELYDSEKSSKINNFLIFCHINRVEYKITGEYKHGVNIGIKIFNVVVEKLYIEVIKDEKLIEKFRKFSIKELTWLFI